MPHSIAMDGPVGAGKSSVASGVAKALGLLQLDTGAMYRAIGLAAVRAGIDPQDEDAASRLGEMTEVAVAYENGVQRTLLNGEDVTALIRTPEVTMAASAVSKWPKVRQRMVALQQGIARGVDIVLDGRDIGTRVLPDATLKVFLTASPEERAKRRCDEGIAKGAPVPYADVLRDLMARDLQDSTRETDPLRQAEDAVLVDSTNMTQDEVVAHIVALYRRAVAAKEEAK